MEATWSPVFPETIMPMTKQSRKPSTYDDFQEILTGYRKSFVLMAAHDLGIFRVLNHEEPTVEGLLEQTGIDPDYGMRFLEALCAMGFLEIEGKHICLTPFSRKYLCVTSDEAQDTSLDFEKTLVGSWHQLRKTLQLGKRMYHTTEKTPEEYNQALSLYLDSMDDAARVRARELWERIEPGQSGVIMDAGAGSGAYLSTFLNLHAGWRGIFCDLPDVIRRALINPGLSPFLDRLDFKTVNFLDHVSNSGNDRADLILCSNLIHCQGREETEGLLSRLVPLLNPNGHLVIHDFFKDQGERGALYDLHMMLNTYNGRTYTIEETCTMVPVKLQHTLALPSGSIALVFSSRSWAQGICT
jgi:hypothetical protein